MDNKDNTLNDNNSESDVTEVQAQEQQPELEGTEQSNQKQSGRGLAMFGLLVALLALVTAGWVYYQVAFQTDQNQALDQLGTMDSQQDLNQLQNRLAQVEKELKQQIQSIDQNKQENEKLHQSLNNLPNNTFDAGPLEHKINNLQQQLTALNNLKREQTIEPQTEEYLSTLARSQSIHALKTVQLLLNQHQLPQAVEVLKQWRNNEHLPLSIQTRLQQLITTLSNTESPDVNRLRQQLSDIKNNITGLSLTTETQASQQPAWYERFITVKKIKPEQQSLNSADLQQLKANAGHSIQQAELALALKQPVLWRDALQQTEHILAQSSLDTEPLRQQLQQLREQDIITQVPNNLGIESLIQQLEGITE